MKNIILILFTFILISSCNTISKDDLEVIDGLQLGTPLDQYNKQLDSLHIEKLLFLPKTLMTTDEKLGLIEGRFTSAFNSTEFTTNVTKHYGLYYPSYYNGTSIIYQLDIILVHYQAATEVSSVGFKSIKINGTQYYGVGQEIATDLTGIIANMFIKKYGLPIDSVKSSSTVFNMIDTKTIQQVYSDDGRVGELLRWKTKYMDIEFFKGVPSTNITYGINAKNYIWKGNDVPNRILDPSFEKPCLLGGYIRYTLNETAIKKLGIDKIKEKI